MLVPDSVMRQLPLVFVSLDISRYMGAAGTVTMLYDWILTFSTELDHIWLSSGWNIPSLLFVVNRYLPIPILLLSQYHGAMRPASFEFSDNFCRGYILTGTTGWAIAQASATWLLSLRVISLYNGRRYIMWSVYAAYFICNIVAVVLTGFTFAQILPKIAFFIPVQVCGALPTGSSVAVAYFLPLLLELYVFALQVMHHYNRNGFRRQANLPTLGLIRTLYIDGYSYFVACMLLKVVTVATWTYATGELFYLSNQFEFSMTVALAARFHLHLRQVANRPLTTLPETNADFSVASIRFNSRNTDVYTSRRGSVEEDLPAPKSHRVSNMSRAAPDDSKPVLGYKSKKRLVLQEEIEPDYGPNMGRTLPIQHPSDEYDHRIEMSRVRTFRRSDV